MKQKEKENYVLFLQEYGEEKNETKYFTEIQLHGVRNRKYLQKITDTNLSLTNQHTKYVQKWHQKKLMQKEKLAQQLYKISNDGVSNVRTFFHLCVGLKIDHNSDQF